MRNLAGRPSSGGRSDRQLLQLFRDRMLAKQNTNKVKMMLIRTPLSKGRVCDFAPGGLEGVCPDEMTRRENARKTHARCAPLFPGPWDRLGTWGPDWVLHVLQETTCSAYVVNTSRPPPTVACRRTSGAPTAFNCMCVRQSNRVQPAQVQIENEESEAPSNNTPVVNWCRIVQPQCRHASHYTSLSSTYSSRRRPPRNAALAV